MPVDTDLFTVVARTEDKLGEIPLWDTRTQSLVWVDLLKPRLNRWDHRSGASTSTVIKEKIGSFCLAEDDSVVITGRSGVSRWWPALDRYEHIACPEADRPANIMNDGRVDGRGRFLFGSMDRMNGGDSGRLWSLTQGEPPRLLIDTGVFVPNGLCWSPCGRVLYFGDSHLDCLFAFDYDLATGAVTNRRVFADTRGIGGTLDGCSVDVDGFVWHARFGAGKLVRFDPKGRIDQSWTMPTRQPTHLTFGGPELRTLYITSARFRMPERELLADPDAGALFAMEVAVKGLPEGRFA
ncbi:SMP-30/gluconolactonase/LRE family protein [Afipia sp. P52-10]|uniref:SMP-30/gluconolactonase/LRE family protein n=1 Tax=Afipia sp. P52-10 TaxID=1429916 RepID=UPI00054E7260|nr:SMP-30/gluconolactonase/LRE family protein [Afipia sp. P52-10]